MKSIIDMVIGRNELDDKSHKPMKKSKHNDNVTCCSSS